VQAVAGAFLAEEAVGQGCRAPVVGTDVPGTARKTGNYPRFAVPNCVSQSLPRLSLDPDVSPSWC
jgi:hypothetical protein